jgi:hypothetical protein
VTSPVGDDIDEAATALVEPIVDRLLTGDPVDWLSELEWHRAVFTKAAAVLSAERGYPLAQLRKRGLSQSEIVALLAPEGVRLSESRVGQLVAGVAGDQTK